MVSSILSIAFVFFFISFLSDLHFLPSAYHIISVFIYIMFFLYLFLALYTRDLVYLFSFIKKKYLFIYLFNFIFGCVGSSLLHVGFL